jgi:hypothetical protein
MDLVRLAIPRRVYTQGACYTGCQSGDGRSAMRSLRHSALLWVTLAALAALIRCGGGSSAPTVTPTAGPTAQPTATPTPLACNPTPPPLRYVAVKIHDDGGYRKTLDSKPIVQNVDGYCARVGAPGRYFCDTRVEGDPQREACDYMAMGRAKDTGRYGPTWYYEGMPCGEGGDQPGCNNHATNQFMVIAKGTGEFTACAADDVPVDPVEGSRCGVKKITSVEPPP